MLNIKQTASVPMIEVTDNYVFSYLTYLELLYMIKNDRKKLLNICKMTCALYYPKNLLHELLDYKSILNNVSLMGNDEEYKIVDFNENERKLYIAKNQMMMNGLDIFDYDTFLMQFEEKLEYLYEKNKQYFLNNKRGKEFYILSDGSLVLMIAYMGNGVKVKPFGKMKNKEDFNELIKLICRYYTNKTKDEIKIQMLDKEKFIDAKYFIIDLCKESCV